MSPEELILDVLCEHDLREIRVRSALACAALTDDVGACDRDLLLGALEEMAEYFYEARKEAEQAQEDAGDAESRLEEALQGGAPAELLEELDALKLEVASLRLLLQGHKAVANAPCERCDRAMAILAGNPPAAKPLRRKVRSR